MSERIYSPDPQEVDVPRTYKPEGQAARFAKSEQTLKEAGGRRINVRLQPKVAKHLDKIMAKQGVDQTTAVNAALLAAK